MANHYGITFVSMKQAGNERVMMYVDKFGIRYERTDKIENNLLLPGKMLKIKTGIVKV